MIILGLETCTPSGGMALMEFGEDGCGRVLAAEVMLSGRAQSRLLGEAIQSALAELGMRMEQVDVVAVSNGPGSFTGVRVGLSLAKGLCILSGGPRMVCVSSLEALVCHAYGGEDVEAVIGMHDALRGEVYARIAPVNKSDLSIDGAKDECLSMRELMDRWPARALVAGEGAFAHREVLERELGDRLVWSRADRALPDPRGVAMIGWKLACRGEWTDASAAAPIYLREATVKLRGG